MKFCVPSDIGMNQWLLFLFLLVRLIFKNIFHASNGYCAKLICCFTGLFKLKVAVRFS